MAFLRLDAHQYAYVLFVLVAFTRCSQPWQESEKILQPEVVEINDLDEIASIKDTIVDPILYRNISGLNNLTVEENKQKFIAIVLPAILVAKYQLDTTCKELKALQSKEQWNEYDSTFFLEQMTRFDARSLDGLLIRLKTHPTSIVIAQAAVESGWGTSRFFGKANNLFGIWSYHSNEPRIAASVKTNGATTYLRKYENISASILDYFETIARSRPYRHFRAMRAKTNDVNELLPLLRNYSSRKGEYVDQLKTIIDQNNLTQYDLHRLNPAFFIEMD